MKTLTVILEQSGDELWAQVEAPGFFYTTTGQTIPEVETNLRELIADYLLHEGKGNPAWAGMSADDIEFNFTTPHETE